MTEGKVSIDRLAVLMSKLGKKNPGIILPPLIGSDVAIYDFNKAEKIALEFYGVDEHCFTIWKSDPITFPTPNLAKYAITVNLNDLTCSGAIPYGILVTWILPTHVNPSTLEKYQNHLHETALKFNISILGGHSEYTSAVIRPLISLSMIGFTPRSFLPSRDLKPGDSIYLLGYIGNEGTAILGEEIKKIKSIPKQIKDELENLEIFENLLSIFKDGVLINKTIRPKLMHDPTEGGLLGALYEMMDPFDFGVRISLELVQNHLHSLTRYLCSYLEINPLRLISSGTLIICTDKKSTDFGLLENVLEHKIIKIGEVIEKKIYLINEEEFGPPQADELISGLKKIEELGS